MTDWAQVRVAELAPITPARLDDRIAFLSEGRAPTGWGRACAAAADLANVRSDVCAAIALKETGRFRYGGTDPVFSADPSYHNFGGIKTSDSKATYRFLTDALGILGLVAHVAWYAHAAHVAYFCDELNDPRHFSWGHRANLRLVSDFGNGIWNTGNTYAPSIASLLAEINA